MGNQAGAFVSMAAPQSTCFSWHSSGFRPNRPSFLRKSHERPTSTTTTTEPSTGQQVSPRGRQCEAQQPVKQQERNAAQRLRTTTAAALSFPWLPLRATKSRGYGSGPPVGACRRIGWGCIRGRRVAAADGCGEWCVQIESGRENTEESRPMMATCSPRVGITLAGASQARLRRRHIENPP